MGAGTIAGALTGFRWRPLYPMRTGMLLALPWPLSALAFAVALPLGVVVPAFVLSGFGIALFGIWWETALAERVPPHLLSRVSAYDWMVSLSLLPVGYLLAGPLGEALGRAARARRRRRAGDGGARLPRCSCARRGRCGGSSAPPQREGQISCRSP